MSDVRVAAISDLHGDLIPADTFPACDLLLIAGDICPVDDHSPRAQQLWLETVFAPWLSQLPAKHIVGIPGNHDLIFARSKKPLAPQLPWHYLLDSEITLCELRLFGTPWVPWIASMWSYQAPKSYGGLFLSEKFAQIPAGIDILISHGPPHCLCDVNINGEHCGSEALRSAIERTRPRLVVCGHVHEGRGISSIGSIERGGWTMVANVSHMGWDYLPQHGPMQFLIPPAPAPVALVREDRR